MGGNSALFDYILYTAKFRDLDNCNTEDEEEESWQLNTAKLTNACISISSNGAKKWGY
jgi:hypothetical protein